MSDDCIGMRYGKLLVLSEGKPRPYKNKDGKILLERTLRVRCDCGAEKTMKASNVIYSNVSCGCKRTKIKVDYRGIKASLFELSRQYGINYSTLSTRIKMGWPIEKAISMRPRKYSQKPLPEVSHF
jgi:hypothetical protein